MKTNETAKKGLVIGAGIGVVLFAIIGFLPGSFIGGAVGMNIAGGLYGMPLEPTIGTRMIMAVSMVFGILVAGFLCVTGTALAGWIMGSIVGHVRTAREQEAAEEAAVEKH